jgi:nucleoside-diphosphate-sugar epimerase
MATKPGPVLVTGSSGFIGSYLVRELLAHGHQVVGIDIQPPSAEMAWVQRKGGPAITLEVGTLEQWGPLAGTLERYRPSAIVHTASLVRPDILEREPFTALRANVESSLNVFEGARVFGIDRVVYTSSIGVLPPVRYRPIDADHPLLLASEATPDTFYGAAKIASEAFGFAYHHALGLDILIVRPSAVYGFGMRWPIYIRPMVEDGLEGRPTRFATGAAMPRDYTHAADVAQMLRLCVEIPRSKVVDRIFYCGTGREPVTAGQVSVIVAELIDGAEIEIGPGLAPDEIRDAATRGAFDMRAAAEQLGFVPLFGDIRDGIAEYIRMYRAYHLEAPTA